MIKKLSKRIFLIIMVSLSIVILGIIILFAFFNYRNTINTSTMILDRVVGGEIRREPTLRPEDEIINKENLIEGIYYITIENSKVITNTDTDNKILEDYAIKISNNKKDSGVIGKFVYKKRRVKEGRTMVIFMESEDTISHINKILIFSIVGSIFSLIIIYVISKKLSKTIVQPVEETIEKQKQFISDASHELKTPLAVIEANADVLENETGDNKWLKYIQNEIESMDKLINELLLLAKIENVNTLKDYKQFNLSKETEIIMSMFESMAYEKNIKIEGKIQENVFMTGNKEDIKHILSTLIDNAIKHTQSGQDVIIELNKERNDILIKVKNIGEPIPEEEKEKIFERFYRIDKSRNRNEKRYGLGLAIAKSTVEKYKGKIEVLYKEKYTIFKVTIPN